MDKLLNDSNTSNYYSSNNLNYFTINDFDFKNAFHIIDTTNYHVNRNCYNVNKSGYYVNRSSDNVDNIGDNNNCRSESLSRVWNI